MAHSNEPSTTESRPRYLTPLDDGHSTTSHFENGGAPTTSRLALGGGEIKAPLPSQSLDRVPSQWAVRRSSWADRRAEAFVAAAGPRTRPDIESRTNRPTLSLSHCTVPPLCAADEAEHQTAAPQWNGWNPADIERGAEALQIFKSVYRLRHRSIDRLHLHSDRTSDRWID